QGADAERGRRRAGVARREVAVDGGSSRRAGEAVVRAAVARVRGRLADRAWLDERPALGAGARAVGGGDAALAVVRPARARAGLAGCRHAAVPVGAAGRAGVRAPARVVGASAAARTGARPGAA